MARLVLPSAFALLGLGIGARATAPYCLAGDDCFPSTEVLNELNATVGGQLIKIEPYGAPCYAESYDEEACKVLIENKHDLEWRAAMPAAVMYTNWEQTADLRGCLVPEPTDDGSMPLPLEGSCTLGNMPSYVVNVTRAEDIVATVKLAAEYNLRFRIKNSGHDYSGRSSGEGSISVWTYHYADAELIEGFVPTDSELEPVNVVSAAPGVDVEKLFKFASEVGVVTIGGYTPSVGAAGGYILGGGTGPLAPFLGLGVDNAVQFDLVLANGTQVSANAQLNPDLYWAVRGGGGAFGVTTRVYIKAHDYYPAINAVVGQVACEDNASFRELVSTMVDMQISVREKGQAGIWQTSPSGTLAVLSHEPFQEPPFKSTNQTMEAFAPLTTVAGCTAQLSATQFTGPTSWYDTWSGAFLPIIQSVGAGGRNLADGSRMISTNSINDPAQRAKMVDHILASPNTFIWQNNVGGVANEVSSDATSVHPDWREAFAFCNEPVYGAWTGVDDEMMARVNASDEALTDAFGFPAYYNEQFPTQENWQEMLFGESYTRLLQVKKEVDPNVVFSCQQCVGSEAGF